MLEDLSTTLADLDARLFAAINGREPHPALDSLMVGFSDKWPWLVIAAAVIIWAAKTRHKGVIKLCLMVGLTIGAADLLTFRVLKPTFARERPCHQLEDVRLLQPSCGSDYGLPSNHAANAMAAATLLALVIKRRWTVALFPVAVVVGLSRVYLGAHFPGDVLLGSIVGCVVALVTYSLFRRTPLLEK